MNYQDNKDQHKERRRLVALRPFIEKRARIIDSLRRSLKDLGFLEVETPLRIPAPAPELHIEAEPSGDCFLVTSPELQMKRLLAAGYGNIFQICHCFRRGERGERHLPEFTMIEWYRTEATINELMDDCERLIGNAATATCGFPVIKGQTGNIDLTPPWERIEVADAFERHAGWRPGARPDPDRFDRDLVSKVEPALPKNRPVFLVGYPASQASLARLDPSNPARAERFELYAGGLELANGFTELVDPDEQRKRFTEEAHARNKAGKAPYPIDEKFLGAMELGLSPCAGIALGLDRLVMLLTGAVTIDNVVTFLPNAM
ncbi:MAG: EF-P lysine aminoacylase GenX [Deltaproteobacteria bacterium]|nr:EF-P lysine aminoacylase GenX [Deltaproteobacteria bacterium]